VLPITVGIKDGVVHLVFTLSSVVRSARAELGSIITSGLPVATVLTHHGGGLGGWTQSLLEHNAALRGVLLQELSDDELTPLLLPPEGERALTVAAVRALYEGEGLPEELLSDVVVFTLEHCKEDVKVRGQHALSADLRTLSRRVLRSPLSPADTAGTARGRAASERFHRAARDT
jgi:hypothetical protein